MSDDEPSRYQRTAKAAAYMGLKAPTLEKDRVSGRLGIPFIKVGKTVLYDLILLDKWLAQHRRLSTSGND